MDCEPAFVREIDAKASAGELHLETAARCLQAMRSVICGKKCSPTAAAYFAATVSTLQKQKPDAEDIGAALLMILRRLIPLVPHLAASRLNDVAQATTTWLRASDAVAQKAMQCLAALAEACYAAEHRPNRKVLKPLFGALSEPRGAVRRQAELATVVLLRRASEDVQSLSFAAQQLAQMLQQAKGEKKEEIPAQRAVSLLRHVLPLLPDEQLGDIFVALARLPALLGQHPCCTEAFELVAQYLTPQAWEEEMAVTSSSHTALAARFLPELLQLPLSLLNVAYVRAFSQALAAAATQLMGQRSPLKLAVCRKLLVLFAEQDPGLLRAGQEAFRMLLRAAGEAEDELVEDLLEAIRPLLRFEAKASWCFSLPVVAELFNAIAAQRSRRDVSGLSDSATFERAKGLVVELVAVRDQSRPGELNLYGAELMEAIGCAVKAFGAKQVLSSMPLELLQHPLTDGAYEQKSRSWMLLALKDMCERSALSDFSGHFLPLASALKAKASEAAQKDALVLEKKYLTLLEQVWALLPGFCREPLDMQTALLANQGQLAKQLVAVLQNEPSLRDHIWVALKHLCLAALEPSCRLAETLKESNQACLRTLSGRVMPEMFNVYIKMYSEMEAQDASRANFSRHQALGAISSYARLAEPEYIGTMFKSLVTKWLKATSEAESMEVLPLGDLATALIPYLKQEHLELVLRVFAPALKGGSEDRAMACAQKAGYRALAAVMRHEAASQWQLQQVTVLWSTLKEARQTCTALKGRLLCLQALLGLLESSLGPRCADAKVREEYLQCLTTIIPEILFHLRDQSTAVREAARESLHLAATTAIHQDLQQEIVTLVSAGLAGLSRHAKGAALDALSRLVYEHHAQMAASLRGRLIQVVLLLLEDQDAQVWRATLKFTKVVVFVEPKESLVDLLPKIMRLFQSKHLASAKMLVRSIVERLAKVMPEAYLESAFPKAHLPLLRHVQKQLSRKGRPKAVRERVEEEEEELATPQARAGRKEVKETWDSFQADADEAEEETDAKARKRRAPAGENEPPTESVMAQQAVQALLNAWEADEEGGRGKRKRGEVAASTWIQEDGDVPIDFMSADAAHSVLTVRAPPSKRLRGQQVGAAGAQNKVDALRREGLTFSTDGRLIVENVEEKEEQPKMFSHGMAEKPKALSQLAMQRKARAQARVKAKAARKGVHLIKGLDTYKPGRKKAQGDAKRKGAKLEPFAYVRLNPKVTKEKFKTKAAETFAKVVQGAKKGVVKGMKARAREQKLKQSRELKKKKQARSKVRRTNSR